VASAKSLPALLQNHLSPVSRTPSAVVRAIVVVAPMSLPALALGRPGAAGQRRTVHAEQWGEIGALDLLRRESIEDMSDGPGERRRAVHRDIRLRQQIPHRETQEIGCCLRPIIQPDDPAPIDLAMHLLLPGIDRERRRRIAVLDTLHQAGRLNAIRVFRAGVDLRSDPLAERL
jgi:hypothetical protein